MIRDWTFLTAAVMHKHVGWWFSVTGLLHYTNLVHKVSLYCLLYICNSLLLLNPTENIPYHSGVIVLEYTVQIILQIQCRIHGKHSYVILDRFMYIIYRCVGYVWQLKKDTLQKKCQKRSNCNAVVLVYFSDYNTTSSTDPWLWSEENT